MIRAREAEDSDRSFLRKLHHAAYRDVVTRQFGKWVESDQDAWFEQKQDSPIKIIELDGVPVGAIAVHDADDHVFLAELQIAPEFQNRGIGSTMLRAELERATELARPLRLRVLFQNHARALYERHGFTVTGHTETHYLMAWEPRSTIGSGRE
ncbi:MAG TPA: GNAT family N-acetyltransferase [Polyangiaceae bacterium]